MEQRKPATDQIRYFGNLLWSKVIENAVANYKWLGDSDTAAALCILPAYSVVYQK